jgi:uncharacterized protein YdbL (DUF1318 family)
MTPTIVFRVLFLAVAMVLGTAVVHAEDVVAVKARMAQRLGSVDSLKEKHVVGENNRGFLEARGALSADEQKIVSDENADRGAVYAALAAQYHITSEQVGRRRAEKIATASAKGVWVQAQDGSWSQKG